MVVPAFDGARPGPDRRDRAEHVRRDGDAAAARARRAASRARRRRRAQSDWSPARHRVISGEEVVELLPALAPRDPTGGYLFYDCQTDDARLVLTVLGEAERFGAICANRLEVIELLREDGRGAGSRSATPRAGSEFAVSADNVVNATGVWADRIRPEELHSEAEVPTIVPSRGTHVIVSQRRAAAARRRDRSGGQRALDLRAAVARLHADRHDRQQLRRRHRPRPARRARTSSTCSTATNAFFGTEPRARRPDRRLRRRAAADLDRRHPQVGRHLAQGGAVRDLERADHDHRRQAHDVAADGQARRRPARRARRPRGAVPHARDPARGAGRSGRPAAGRGRRRRSRTRRWPARYGHAARDASCALAARARRAGAADRPGLPGPARRGGVRARATSRRAPSATCCCAARGSGCSPRARALGAGGDGAAAGGAGAGRRAGLGRARGSRPRSSASGDEARGRGHRRGRASGKVGARWTRCSSSAGGARARGRSRMQAAARGVATRRRPDRIDAARGGGAGVPRAGRDESPAIGRSRSTRGSATGLRRTLAARSPARWRTRPPAPEHQREALALRELAGTLPRGDRACDGDRAGGVAPLLAHAGCGLRARRRGADVEHETACDGARARAGAARPPPGRRAGQRGGRGVAARAHGLDARRAARSRTPRCSRRPSATARGAVERNVRTAGSSDRSGAPLRTSRGTLELGGRPWLMGIVNATPDSFSDAGRAPDAGGAGRACRIAVARRRGRDRHRRRVRGDEPARRWPRGGDRAGRAADRARRRRARRARLGRHLQAGRGARGDRRRRRDRQRRQRAARSRARRRVRRDGRRRWC